MCDLENSYIQQIPFDCDCHICKPIVCDCPNCYCTCEECLEKGGPVKIPNYKFCNHNTNCFMKQKFINKKKKKKEIINEFTIDNLLFKINGYQLNIYYKNKYISCIESLNTWNYDSAYNHTVDQIKLIQILCKI
tara:strand:+ start:133 stop:534 length:402 start_codon:yes stop_codon:yes gene_type:complete